MTAGEGSVRRAFLDRSPGETRGVVLQDGRPERLLIVREGDATPRLGARYAARVEAVSERMGLARLDLGAAAGTLRLRGLSAMPHVGQRLEAEVVVEPVRGKPAVLRFVGGGPAGTPGLLVPPTPVEAQLAVLVVTPADTGVDAREQADAAQAEALATEHAISLGATLSVELTRALTAVDVDLAETGAAASVSRANLLAIGHAARLLRLKALGGLVVIDLIGFPREARRLEEAARAAFRPDGSEVVVAPLSRFGVLELAKPHARQPLAERLLDPDGRPSALTVALDLVRSMERQGRFNPGARVLAACAPEVAALAGPLAERLGPRFGARAELGAGRGHTDITLS